MKALYTKLLVLTLFFITGALATGGVNSCMKSLNHTLESFAKEHHFQGTLAIAKSCEILFSRSNGHCGANKTCKLNTQYAIGSLTKQFTSVALLRVLLDEVCKGKAEGVQIALKKPLIHFIPKNHVFWGELPAPRWAYKVTLHHLLSNTSGLKDVSVPAYMKFGRIPRSRQGLVSLYNQQNDQLSFEPGSKYE